MSDYWSLQDTLSYFQEDEEIKNVLTAEEFKRINNPNEYYLKVLKTALEYQRFDPKVILRQMIRNRASYLALKKDDQKWDLSNMSDDFRWTENSAEKDKFSSMGPLSTDIEFLIFMFLLTNNHISKTIKKSMAGIADILEMLKEKYDINDEVRKSGTALGSKDITLPRIACVMPSAAVVLFHKRAIKETVQFMTIPGVRSIITDESDPSPSGSRDDCVAVSEITHAICCPFLPSLHPKTTTGGTHIHALLLYVAVRLDDIIHKKVKDFTPLEELVTYYKARFDSTATPQTARVHVMRKIGLMSSNSTKFTEEALRVSQACYAELQSMRVDDPYHSTFMIIAKTGVIPE